MSHARDRGTPALARLTDLLVGLAAALAACGGQSAAGEDAAAGVDAGVDGGGAADGGAADGAPGDAPAFLLRLPGQTEFAALAGEGGEVKYLARVNGRQPLAPLATVWGTDGACVFQNTARYAGHITFLKSFPALAHLDFSSYLALVMNQASRVHWGGELKFFPGAVHPRTGARGVLAYFVYSGSGDAEGLTPAQLAEVDERLKGCVPWARSMLVLVGMDAEQAGRFAAQEAALRALGVDTVDARALRPGVQAEGYSLGEGYGYLRVVPRGQRAGQVYVGPREVVIAESATEDLGLVAGLVTAFPQNVYSHVNLRLRDKRVPNASVASIFDNQIVPLLEGQLVRIEVKAAEVTIGPAPLAAAEAFWASRRPVLPAPVADLAETRLRGLSELRARDAVAYGTKAANLAELHAVLPAVNRVPGFAIPFAAYRDLLQGAGVVARIEAMLADPRVHTDAAFRRGALDGIRDAIEDAPVPAALLGQVAEAARAAFGPDFARTPLRFRSSSNVEDGEHLSGAGLHDSARGCFADDMDGDALGPSACLAGDERAAMEAELARHQEELRAHPARTWLVEVIDDLAKDLANERPVARALKKVYASLWNERAFEERAYFGIDHRAAFMGVAVNPSFVLEKLDAVAVTNLDAGAGGPLYRVSSQVGGIGVARPIDPTAVAEVMTWRRGAGDAPADVQVITRSSLSTAPLWSEARLAELARLLATVQDHFATQVYVRPGRLSLDAEIKLTRDDRVVIKQARLFTQGAP